MPGAIKIPTYIYRFTHIDNLEWLLENGIVPTNSPIRYSNYTCLGDTTIINRRNFKQVEVSPFGTLGDYVPFYFNPKSPMLYKISMDQPQVVKDIIFFVSSAQLILEKNLPFVFTDGHALVEYSGYYGTLDDLNQVDWSVMSAKYWKNEPDDMDKRRRREAEFLVHGTVPIDSIGAIATNSNETLERVRKICQSQKITLPVHILPKCYY